MKKLFLFVALFFFALGVNYNNEYKNMENNTANWFAYGVEPINKYSVARESGKMITYDHQKHKDNFLARTLIFIKEMFNFESVLTKTIYAYVAGVIFLLMATGKNLKEFLSKTLDVFT